MIKIGGLFSGIGGLESAVCDVFQNSSVAWCAEQDKWRQSVLRYHHPKAKIFDDVRMVQKGEVSSVDIVCGGWPCRDISRAAAASGRLGLDGKNSGLFFEIIRVLEETRPRVVVLENVAAILDLDYGYHWGRVLGEMAALGYAVRWTCIRAGDVGLPIHRDRLFALAWTGPWCFVASPNTGRRQRNTQRNGTEIEHESPHQRRMDIDGPLQWTTYPETRRVADGVVGTPRALARALVSAIGDACAPQQAAQALRYMIAQGAPA